MIILPDKNIPKSKFLMPVNKKDWMPSSQAIFKDEFGNDSIRTFFVVKAVLNDGFVKWKGTFFDRDDFDAFLFSIATGTLKYEKHLWNLCSPEWHPDIGENLSYEFATFTYITNTSNGLSYTIPIDWDSSNNFIDCIGGGASGCAFNSTNTNSRAGGGGGGGWARRTNYVASFGTVIGYKVGIGGAARTDSVANLTEVDGQGGGTTFFDTSVFFTSSIVAATGGTGGSGVTNETGGGGSPGTFSGGYTSGFQGGSGAAGSASVPNGGGGGAAGPRGRGNPEFSSNGTGSGGTGDGGNTPSDSNGTYYSASPAYGAGGGGSGGLSGGTYGAGGGGQRSLNSSVTSGAGRQGLLVLSYEPYVSRPFFNLPTLGL